MARGLLREQLARSEQVVTARRDPAPGLPDATRIAIRDEAIQGLSADWATRVLTDPSFRREVDRRIEAAVDTQVRAVPGLSRSSVLLEMRAELLGYGPLQSLLDDPTVTEIMVNGPAKIRVEHAGGRLQWTDARFRDQAHLRAIVAKMLAPLGREITEASPLIDARLPDGSRVAVVGPPIALGGIALNIRRFPRAFTAGELVEMGAMDVHVADLLALGVLSRMNIVVSGGTSSGKTTLLNAVSSFCHPDEHIVTIEDSAELQLRQADVVCLEARQPNMEGVGAIPIRRLVSHALRMRPDRIIVGEVRGGEALDMLQAMNTGHDGSLTTVHANSPQDAVERLVTLALMADSGLTEHAIRRQVTAAVEMIVQVSRSPDGTRRVTEIAEVLSEGEGGQAVVTPIVRWDRDAWVPTFHVPHRLIAKVRRAGLQAPDLLLSGKGAAN